MFSKPQSILMPVILAAMLLSPTRTHAGPLPPLINFQSVLLDEGGNLLPSGPTTIQFQILDEQRNPLYFESQNVDIVKGAVSVLIGNGTAGSGQATGGIPEDIFASGAPRYLQVQVGSQRPEEPMTIVPVPYAQWSQSCASVADGAVGTAQIAKGSVGFESLAPDVIEQLSAAKALAGTSGAATVGVTAKFMNSGSSSVQGVLQDIDLSVKKNQEMDSFLTGKLNQEVTDRTNAVAGVQGKLSQEIVNRTTDTQNLQSQINKFTDGTATSKISPGSIDFGIPLPSDLNMGGHKITNLGAPANNNDAATKAYVDSKFVAAPNTSTPPDSKSLAKAWAFGTIKGPTVQMTTAIVGSYNVSKAEVYYVDDKVTYLRITWATVFKDTSYVVMANVTKPSSNFNSGDSVGIFNRTTTTVDLSLPGANNGSSFDHTFNVIAFGN